MSARVEAWVPEAKIQVLFANGAPVDQIASSSATATAVLR
jgi:hypothetical protein